jgi:hypothetical protein
MPETRNKSFKMKPNFLSINFSLSIFFSVFVSSFLAACGSGVDVQSAGQQAALSNTQSVSVKAVANITPIYRFARLSNGAYFYTGSKTESDYIQATNVDFRYEGIAFYGYESGGRTVFRFANVTNGGYFYTASVAERDAVLAHPVYSQRFRLDNATFQVALESDTSALPVYRLANLVNGAYLYTTSAAEVSYAVNQLRIWRDEGMQFSVPAASAPFLVPGSIRPPFGYFTMDQYAYINDAGSTNAIANTPFPIYSGIVASSYRGGPENDASVVYGDLFSGGKFEALFKGRAAGVYTIVSSGVTLEAAPESSKLIQLTVTLGDNPQGPKMFNSLYVSDSGQINVTVDANNRFHFSTIGPVLMRKKGASNGGSQPSTMTLSAYDLVGNLIIQ